VNSVPGRVAIPEFPPTFESRASCHFKRVVVIFSQLTLIRLMILAIITQNFATEDTVSLYQLIFTCFNIHIIVAGVSSYTKKKHCRSIYQHQYAYQITQLHIFVV
jgi:hypothetical protein